MKVTVNRSLNAGKYRVSFSVKDFTTDELAKMSSFGVPGVDIKFMSGATLTAGRVSITQISDRLEAAFGSEEAAQQYESEVLRQIKTAMDQLRSQIDGFTSTAEIEL
jgi:hypothetical protein